MHPVTKVAIYLGLTTLSWSSGFGRGAPRLAELQELTSCAKIEPAEREAHARTYGAHVCYYGYELLAPHRDKSYSAHHIATCFLVLISWAALGTGGVRLGTVVMFLHSVTDIALQLTRLLPMVLPKVLACVSLLVSWAACRLWYFGYIIYTVYRVKEQEYADCGTADSFLPVWIASIAMLNVLFCLNCYWFALIWSKLYTKVCLPRLA